MYATPRLFCSAASILAAPRPACAKTDGRAAKKIERPMAMHAASATSQRDFRAIFRSSVFFVRSGANDSTSFFHRDGLACRNIFQAIHMAAGPMNFHLAYARILAQAESKNKLARGQIARAARQHLILRHASRGHVHH